MLILIWKKKPLSALTKNSFSSSPGRAGRILTRHKATSFNKRKYRVVNNKPFLLSDTAQILRVEYNSQKSAFVGLSRFLKSGFLSYLPISSDSKPGDFVYINPPSNKISSLGTISLSSNRRASVVAPLYKFPKGSLISNLSVVPFGPFSICRGAGTRAKVISFSADKRLVEVLMPSGRIAYLNSNCFAVSGAASNPSHFLRKDNKAGQSFFKGIRPSVRGVAMNPVDHPMGGGEGKSSGGRPSVSRWGKLTKGGFKTRSVVKNAKYLKIKKSFLKH